METSGRWQSIAGLTSVVTSVINVRWRNSEQKCAVASEVITTMSRKLLSTLLISSLSGICNEIRDDQLPERKAGLAGNATIAAENAARHFQSACLGAIIFSDHDHRPSASAEGSRPPS
jgi:hypothetical protein